VYVDPQNVTAFPGETFVITVKVANVTNLFGLELGFAWNPAIIKYVNHTVMMPMEDFPGGILHKPIMMVKNEVNESGIERKSGVFEPDRLYWVACVSFKAPSSFNGTGTVFSMAFEVINTGECTLHISHTILADRPVRVCPSQPIPHMVRDGYFTSARSTHDVGVFLDAPLHVLPRTVVPLKLGIVNSGFFNESDVTLDLWIDGALVKTFAIPLLEVNASSIQTYSWAPTAEATYNITVHSFQVQNETHVSNNVNAVETLVSNVIRVPLHSTTIQKAIDMASAGATISVSPGTYYERLVIDKRVTLIGAGQATIVGGQENDQVVKIFADNVVFNGFTIRNGFLSGVYICRGNNVTVTHTHISDMQGGSNAGIFILDSSNTSILFNEISNIDIGLALGNIEATTYHRVVGNTIVNCTTALDARRAVNSSIHHNNFINNTDQLRQLNTNMWHDEANEGNYWSDYAGIDLDGDGVGDTSLPHQGVDYYPLMEPVNLTISEFPSL